MTRDDTLSLATHFLTVRDFSRSAVLSLLDSAKTLKLQQQERLPHSVLSGYSLAMIFQKPSNRTRVSFEVGMYQLGGKAVHLRASEIGFGTRETIADIARNLERFVDIVMIRSNHHEDIEEYARYSRVPVINGLSDLYHPCQALADVLTIEEQFNRLEQLKICYVGDGNNVCHSLALIASILGLEMVVCCPKGYEPTVDLPSDVRIEHDIVKATSQAHVIYTDVWTSMGQEDEYQKRLDDFKGYMVSESCFDQAASDAVFMHCLPAKRGVEVTSEVMASSRSVVFDQAENRLHAQKAIMVSLLGKTEKVG